MRSDALLAADWRVTCLESADCLSDEDRRWLSVLSRESAALSEGEPQWEFAWRSVGMRARRVLVRHWHPST